jgi:hypothetical protein
VEEVELGVERGRVAEVEHVKGAAFGSSHLFVSELDVLVLGGELPDLAEITVELF